MKRNPSESGTKNLADELDELGRPNATVLRQRWRVLYRTEAPSYRDGSPNLPRGWRRPRTPNVAADRPRHARGDCFPPTAGPATYGCTRAMAVPQIEPKKMSGVAAYSPATHTLLSLGSTPAPE